jgi:hypothetical protein
VQLFGSILAFRECSPEKCILTHDFSLRQHGKNLAWQALKIAQKITRKRESA